MASVFTRPGFWKLVRSVGIRLLLRGRSGSLERWGWSYEPIHAPGGEVAYHAWAWRFRDGSFLTLQVLGWNGRHRVRVESRYFLAAGAAAPAGGVLGPITDRVPVSGSLVGS